MNFCHLLENMQKNYWVLLLKKVINKAAEATGKYLGDKFADAVAKSYDDKIIKTKSVEEIIILPDKKEEILKELRQAL